MTYKEYIQNILDTRGRFNCGEEYHERHHIVPRCMGGMDDKENLIDLFAREHFDVHRLLALENPDNDKLQYALWCMCSLPGSSKKRDDVTSEEYEEARIRFAKVMSERMKGENHPMYGVHRYGEDAPMYGKHQSDETRRRISNAFKGENHPLYGKHHSEESKQKMKERAKDRLLNPENHPMYGRYHTEESKKKMSDAKSGEKHPNYGKHRSEETCKKLSEVNKGEKNPNYGKHPSKATHKKHSESVSGKNNPRARKVIRLVDLKIYTHLNAAAEDNGMNKTTIIRKCKNHKDFMYYDEWLQEQNNLEK